MRKLSKIAALIGLVAALAPASSHAKSACDWPMYGQNLGRTMAQSCSQITPLNVATLHPKWVFNTNAPVTAQPAVVDGTVYVGAADGTFYALPADGAGTVTPKWTFTIGDKNTTSYGRFVSSAAVADVDGKRVVVVGGGSTLYVLDAANGHQLASQCFDPRAGGTCSGSNQVIEIESSPAIVPNQGSGVSARIYVGVDYNEGNPGRGGMVKLVLTHQPIADTWALNADWKFDPEKLGTWTGTSVFTGGNTSGQGCGNVWSSPMVHDGLVYFDTSNCETGRYSNHSLYGGESVFAIDADTGALVWCYSPRPVNDADLDFGATPNLLSGNRVGAGGKDGTYYAFGGAAAAPVSTDPATACRGGNGQTPGWASTVATGGSIDGIIGTPAVGVAGGAEAVFATNAIPMPDADTFSNPQRLTTLHAIRASDGAVLWDAPNVFPAYAGPAYANGLVFMPDTFGMNFSIYSADYGVPLRTFPMLAPSGPPAITADSVYVGSGVEPDASTPVLSQLGAVYAFQAVVAAG